MVVVKGFLFILMLIISILELVNLIMNFIIGVYREPHIKFKCFKNLYYIAPEKWKIDLEDFSVGYHNRNSNDGERRWLYFPRLSDKIRLMLFKHEIDKEWYENNRKKQMTDLIKDWQKDIDRVKEKIGG